MEANFDHLARRQHGLVTTGQLHDLGWSERAIRWAVGSGRLDPVRRGVLRPAGATPTRKQAWMAAVLGCRTPAVLSHATAATLSGWSGFDDLGLIDLLVEGRQRPRLPGVRGHRTASLPRAHRTEHRGIPVTTPERTLVDACGLVPFRVLEDCVDQALRHRALRLDRVVRVLAEVPASGRRRLEPVMALLGERVPGFDPGASRPEIDLVRVLVKAGFERPEQQIRVRTEGHTYFVDAGWRSLKVGFEYDSVEVHHTVSAFHRDRERLRRLQRAGWSIWSVTSRTSANEILAIAALAFDRQCAGQDTG